MPQGEGGGPKPGYKSLVTRKREADADDPTGLKRQAIKANFFTPRVIQDRHSELEALEAVADAPSQDEEDTTMRDDDVDTAGCMDRSAVDNSASSCVTTGGTQSPEIPLLPCKQDREEGKLYRDKFGRLVRYKKAWNSIGFQGCAS